MTIIEISNNINSLSIDGKRPFSDLQMIRYKNGANPRTWKPFAAFSIKDFYAFHAGGRKELQFNIGEDWIKGITVFRYGIAFSLKEDKTLHNSKAEFKESINRFNIFIHNHPHFFDDYKMWYYKGEEFGEYFEKVRIIDDQLFKAENFIFIGKYFEKDIDDIDDLDINSIIDSFDYLISAYEEIQFGKVQIEKRISRLAFNTNGWVMPSGPFGKSNYPDSHEAKFGYGHEEWLLDTGKLINGYHYGFIEPIRKQQEAYYGNVFNVWLYTINGENKKRFWVGEIRNVEILSQDDAEIIKSTYVTNGWYQEMKDQIKASGANVKGFSDWKGVDLFNIRYKPIDLIVNDPYFELPSNHPVYQQSRYSFTHFKDEFIVLDEEIDNFGFTESDVTDDEEDAVVETKKYQREPKSVEIKYLHKTISKQLTKFLRVKYGVQKVTPEHPSGYGGNKIDIVVQTNIEGLVFYEIKTYNSLKTSIREAIGQLMEYSLWPNMNKADQMIIITQKHEDVSKAALYFQHLRNTFNIPLYYQWFDHETNELSEKF